MIATPQKIEVLVTRFVTPAVGLWTLDFGQQISHCVPKFPHPDTGPRIFFGLTRILSRVSVTGEALAIRILGFDNNINRDT